MRNWHTILLDALIILAEAQAVFNEHIDKLPMTLIMISIFPLEQLAFLFWDSAAIILLFAWTDHIAVLDDVLVPLFEKVIHGHVGAEQVRYGVFPASLLLLALEFFWHILEGTIMQWRTLMPAKDW